MPDTSHRRSWFGIGFSLLGSTLVATGCADPTEIRLHVFTNVPCTDPAEWKGVAVYVGRADANLEDKAPALSTMSCDQYGQVGSLVVVPSGSKDDEIGLRVVAGISRNPEDCASHQYQGCIVARRSVRFNRHTTLDLDIELTSDCRGVGCDAAHTCIEGTCSDTHTADATLNLPDAQGPNSVRCGDNGVFCPTTGNVCCLSVNREAKTTFGDCRPASTCPSTNLILYCDDESDCTGLSDDQGRIGMCMVSYTQAEGTLFTPTAVAGSQCTHHAGTAGIRNYGLQLCQTRLPCLGGARLCESSDNGVPNTPLPGYYWCVVDEPNSQ